MQEANFQFRDKVALVTGATGGIGRAIVGTLASHGAAVVVPWGRSADRSSAKADAVVREIVERGHHAVAIEADLANVQEIRALYAAAVRWRGRLDIVVNCAGVQMEAPVAEFSETDYDRLFAINTKGVFFSLQEAARVVERGGRIINVSSGSTNVARPGNSVYGGSKSAVEYFTRALAWELASRDITVNTVSPGLTDTPMINDELRRIGVMKSPFRRLGRPEDVADVILLLASQEARWITGQNIMATGGSEIR